MKYYIVSRWRNRDKVFELINKMKKIIGDNIYCFFDFKNNIHSKDYNPKKAMKEFESLENWRNDERVKNMFRESLKTIKKSDVIVLLLPAGKSSHIEIGIARGLNKKCILIGKQKKAETSYLIFDEFYETISDFIDSLNGANEKF